MYTQASSPGHSGGLSLLKKGLGPPARPRVRALPCVSQCRPRSPRSRAESRAGPLKALASCALGPSLAVVSSRLRPRRGSHLNFSSSCAARRHRSAGGGHPTARVACVTSGLARFPPLKSTSDTIKTKQNAHRPPKPERPTPTDKLAPIPSTCKPGPSLAGLRCPSPRPSRPRAAETAPRRGPSWEVARHGSERSRP